MTPDELIEQANVLIAHANGAKIQFSWHDGPWKDCINYVDPKETRSIGPDFSCMRYRVKPTPAPPRELWVDLGGSEACCTKKRCKSFVAIEHHLTTGGDWRKFREVIE